MSETNTYRIFDGSEGEFTQVIASNANIRKVCTICTQATFKTDEERLYYAQQGDIQPQKYDKAGNPSYSFSNIYLQGPFWAALAQNLFYDAPKMIQVKKGKPVVADDEHYEKLNRGEVRRAFDDFLGKFAATPYEVRSLFNLLDSGQKRAILQKAKNLKTAQDGNTKMPS